MEGKTGSLVEDLNHLSAILAERGKAEGAKILGKDVFVHTYQVTVRYLRRYEKDAEKMQRLIDNLEDLDDVTEVYHNWEE